MKRILQILPLLLTLLAIYKTYPLRLISYDKIPAPGITFDEYAFAWTGEGLAKTGMPVGWTTNLSAYKADYYNGDLAGWGLKTDGLEPVWTNLPQIHKPSIATITFDYGLGDRYIDLVQPYFDHPPLAGLIYSLGIPDDLPELTDVTPADFRRANSVIGAVTALLIFILGLQLYSPWVGFLAALVYSTMPTTLLSSRLTLAENITAPLFLVSMIFLQLGLSRKKSWPFIASGLAAGACTLAKFSGISVAVAGVLILFFFKSDRSRYLQFILAFVAAVIPYFIYANLLAPELFWRVMLNQSSRGDWGIINLFQSVQRIHFPGFPLDGWWTGGWLVLLFLAGETKKHLTMTVMALSLILVTTLLGGYNFGWYFFPMGILISLGWGVVIKEIISSPDFKNLSVFFLFAVTGSLYWGYLRINPQLNLTWTVRAMAAIFIASGLFLPRYLKKYPALKFLWLVFMVFVIHRLYLWNTRGFLHILSQWGQLPSPLMIP